MLKEQNVEFTQSYRVEVVDLMLAIKQHGDEPRKQGELLDRMLDLVSGHQNAQIAAEPHPLMSI